MNKSTTEIRQAFLDFFHSKGHQVVNSSSLIPKEDQTLLFTNAGMNQFKNVFLGLDNRNYSRATTSQRCVRAGGKHNDLKNVGYTEYHHTFFEMLGNFSFGDYFKYDAINYAWELLTSKNWFSIPKERLWVTVYETDDEAYEIWRKEIGIPSKRIIRIGDDNKDTPYISDNFWQMGDTGPCGPCTEIFYDYGDQVYGSPPGNIKNGDRYIEIWNIVFMQFNRQIDGTMKMLPKPSVDTGMGLERIAAVMQQVSSNYEIDLFRTLIEAVAKITNTTDLKNKSLRVIADHIRSCAFLISDSVIPSYENLGYVLRRLIRRAVHHGNMLGTRDIFFYKLVEPLIAVMGSIGDELKRQQDRIEQVLKIEEEHFAHTLERGLILLDKELEKVKGDTLDGEVAFRLYDTYGFPVDLTIDVCRERNIKVDEVGFEAAMEEQRFRARRSSVFYKDYNAMICVDNVTEFKGYESLELNGKVIALFIDNKAVDRINTGQDAVIILDKTPFYAESGGQIGDKGKIKGNNSKFLVNNTQKYGQAIGHSGKLIFGSLKLNEHVQAQVDKIHRSQISLNHTATHLMHAALREILGIHVVQKSSLITSKMLRFDFLHFKAMELSEIYAVENLVNLWIRHNLPAKTTVMNLDAVKEKDIIALSGKKYNKYVRVLSIGDFSTELCVGTHVSFTGDIGMFRIVSEFSTASGIRRIEAVTGEEAMASIHSQSSQLHEIAQMLKSDIQSLSKKVCSILKRNQQLEKELKKLRKQVAAKDIISLSSKAVEIKGVKLLVSKLIGTEPKTMRNMVKDLKSQLGSAIVVLATVNQDKIFLIAGVSKNITDRVKAEELINMIAQQVNGKGGGRPNIAQAGGTDISALPAALASIEDWVNDKL